MLNLLALPILILLIEARPININCSQENPGNHNHVNIVVLDAVSFYGVDKNYTFFIPKVDPQCECACSDTLAKCSESTRKDQLECGSFSNTTSTCTVYNYEGTDPKICPKKYQVCCKVYFTKDLISGDHVAVYLKYNKTEYKLKVDIEDANGQVNEYIIFVSDGMDRIILSEDTILQFSPLPRLISINESWYYSSKKSLDLFLTSAINDRDGEHLHKIGWFKYGLYEEISRIPLTYLKENFKVHLTNLSNFTWELNATGYSRKKGHVNFPPDARLLAEQNDISDVTFSLREKFVKIKENYRPSVKASLSRVSASLNDGHFMFYSTITLSNDVYKLNLHFIQGSGSFIVKVIFPYLNKILTIPLTVGNASTRHPFKHEKEIKMDDFQPPRICVQQEETVVCQSSSIISISSINVSTTDETFGNNSCNIVIWAIIISIFSVAIGVVIGWLLKSYVGNTRWFNIRNNCTNQEGSQNLGRNLTEPREKETAFQEENSISLVEKNLE